jgi:hypothetical protein
VRGHAPARRRRHGAPAIRLPTRGTRGAPASRAPAHPCARSSGGAPRDLEAVDARRLRSSKPNPLTGWSKRRPVSATGPVHPRSGAGVPARRPTVGPDVHAELGRTQAIAIREVAGPVRQSSRPRTMPGLLMNSSSSSSRGRRAQVECRRGPARRARSTGRPRSASGAGTDGRRSGPSRS